jgi:hypothetical protein
MNRTPVSSSNLASVKGEKRTGTLSGGQRARDCREGIRQQGIEYLKGFCKNLGTNSKRRH